MENMGKEIIFSLIFAFLIAMVFAFAPIKYNQPVLVSQIVVAFIAGMASFGTILGFFSLHGFYKSIGI